MALSRAVESVSVLLVGVLLGGLGHWGYQKQTQKAETALEANKTVMQLVEETRDQNKKILDQNKAIAPGILQANKALNELKGKVNDFKDLDLCIVPDDLARLLDVQLDAYNKNRTPSSGRLPKN